jgi:hypothetical protein
MSAVNENLEWSRSVRGRCASMQRNHPVLRAIAREAIGTGLRLRSVQGLRVCGQMLIRMTWQSFSTSLGSTASDRSSCRTTAECHPVGPLRWLALLLWVCRKWAASLADVQRVGPTFQMALAPVRDAREPFPSSGCVQLDFYTEVPWSLDAPEPD